ncbi:chaperone dnaJ [Raphidocelis subcapitata]|uniref:Chaperone dnaJ n=1 Tax=Raphidocelis subcapitata TaxID=307507 RepID=A0A2V0PAT6_9CHLO|nr:chaperone dnaJ [Raphidocelis subcapitata]|eukprot:GBF96052.1 chaperone dnaJ [Raphidocelis subcapitata]
MLAAPSGRACCRGHARHCAGAAGSQPGPAAAAAAAAARRAPLAPLRLAFDPLRAHRRRRARLAAAEAQQPLSPDTDSFALPETFCIIESRDAVKDFASMQLDEIGDNIAARRNRIFLLMEEVRRLRIQQRLKVGRGR